MLGDEGSSQGTPLERGPAAGPEGARKLTHTVLLLIEDVPPLLLPSLPFLFLSASLCVCILGGGFPRFRASNIIKSWVFFLGQTHCGQEMIYPLTASILKCWLAFPHSIDIFPTQISVGVQSQTFSPLGNHSINSANFKQASWGKWFIPLGEIFFPPAVCFADRARMRNPPSHPLTPRVCQKSIFFCDKIANR